jgi:PBP1b-binding outer membrane lipoprotein LpoB
MKSILTIILLILVVAGCNWTGNKNGGTENGSTKSAKAEPVKDEAVRVLRAALSALEAKDYDKAATFFKIPANASSEEKKTQLARLLELNEISKTGIDILARDGKWGKLDEAFDAERAKRFAERANVPLESCYGLSLKNAEAGFYWDGEQFKIIRCDDIGKLG